MKKLLILTLMISLSLILAPQVLAQQAEEITAPAPYTSPHIAAKLELFMRTQKMLDLKRRRDVC